MSSEMGPNAEIKQALSDFITRVPVWALTTFTIDGYVIAYKMASDKIPNELEFVISSLSSGLITISEDFIRFIDDSKIFKQILVDSESRDGEVSFSIILKHIADNVLLSCIFPHTTQLGLLIFELDNLQRMIKEIVSKWDVKLHRETMT